MMPNHPHEISEFDKTSKFFKRLVSAFRPPEGLGVKAWAEKYRYLPEGLTAEAGRWRCSRTPYLEEPLNAFTDPAVEQITVMAGSQMGKSEFELNILGYMIDEEPCPALYIQPTVEDARKFAVNRINPMISCSRKLAAKVLDNKGGRDTIAHKIYPGGSVTLVGANSVSGLSSTPIRVVLADEIDRFKSSAGREGDPYGLAKARTITFFNRKMIRVSSPSVKGDSAIETAFLEGTQELWCHMCPGCGAWAPITFSNIKFEYEERQAGRQKHYRILSLHLHIIKMLCIYR